MSRNLNIPYFPNPPREYTQGYMAQLVQAFAVFAQQAQVPGPVQATRLKLTDLSAFADNAAAIAGGLVVGDIYRTAAGELRVVV